MNILRSVRNLCTPAYVYLVMSMISIIIIMFQNAGNETKFCVGSYSCKVASTSFVFICQGLYTAFWTFVLDAICARGYTNISWYLILFPYLLFFIIIGLLILADNKKEGMGLGGKKREEMTDEQRKVNKKCKEKPSFHECIVDKDFCWPYPEGCGINPYLLRKKRKKKKKGGEQEEEEEEQEEEEEEEEEDGDDDDGDDE